MNIIVCCKCENDKKVISDMLSKYTEDWEKYYQGTTTERMYEAGKRSMLIELKRLREEETTI